MLHVPTAVGDAPEYTLAFYERWSQLGRPSHLRFFPYPPADLRELVLSQDAISVGGGNTANMLAIWRVHGFDGSCARPGRAASCSSAASAGMICWFEAGVTDSFGPQLEGMGDGLGFLAGSACPHYDGEALRRPRYRELVDGGFPDGLAADDGVGLHFVGHRAARRRHVPAGRGRLPGHARRRGVARSARPGNRLVTRRLWQIRHTEGMTNTSILGDRCCRSGSSSASPVARRQRLLPAAHRVATARSSPQWASSSATACSPSAGHRRTFADAFASASRTLYAVERGSAVEQGSIVFEEESVEDEEIWHDDDSGDHDGWFCVRTDPFPCPAAGCTYVATFMTAAHLILCWQENDDPNLLRHAARARDVGRNPRIVGYQSDYGPSASYYAWIAAGRPVHGIRAQ